MTLSVASIALTADLPHPDPPIPESDFGGSAANGSDFRRRAISDQFGGRAAGRQGREGGLARGPGRRRTGDGRRPGEGRQTGQGRRAGGRAAAGRRGAADRLSRGAGEGRRASGLLGGWGVEGIAATILAGPPGRGLGPFGV